MVQEKTRKHVFGTWKNLRDSHTITDVTSGWPVLRTVLVRHYREKEFVIRDHDLPLHFMSWYFQISRRRTMARTKQTAGRSTGGPRPPRMLLQRQQQLRRQQQQAKRRDEASSSSSQLPGPGADADRRCVVWMLVAILYYFRVYRQEEDEERIAQMEAEEAAILLDLAENHQGEMYVVCCLCAVCVAVWQCIDYYYCGFSCCSRM